MSNAQTHSSNKRKSVVSSMADQISRRNILQAGGLGVAAALSSSVSAKAEKKQTSNSTIDWDFEVDVAVCGSGAAGCMAALTASQNGSSVMLLEKSSVWGGTTAKSGFHIWIPNNEAMKAMGIEDNKLDCLRYMAQHSYPHLFDINSPTMGLSDHIYTLLDTYYDVARKAVKKLADWDVVNFKVAELGRPPIVAVDYNENSPFNKAIIGRSMGPIDRNGRDQMGRYVINEFRQRLNDEKVDIRLQHRAVKLHMNNQRQVTGVQVEVKGKEKINIRTRQGVVFGSGCYTGNKQYLNQFQMMPIMGGCGAPSNEGDFIGIGGTVGAQLGNMSGAWRAQVVLEDTIDYVSAPAAVFWPIGDSMFIVNKYGKRCFNEKRNYNDRTKGLFRYDANLCEFPDMINFMVYDQRCAELFSGIYPMTDKPEAVEYVIQGETLSELANNIEARLKKHSAHTGNLKLDGAFTEQLQASFKRYNKMAKTGVDEDFQRGSFAYDKAWHDMKGARPSTKWPDTVNPDNTTMHPLQKKGPYFAVILLPGCIGTNGGPVINENGQVLDYHNQAIDGLYGAGNCIASPAANAYWGGGTTIGSALVFGYQSGKTVAKAKRLSSSDTRASAQMGAV